MYSSRLSPVQRSSFNFHCIICFEAFHPEYRPPVVLPCGHTFICAPCSKRITRCMECRTSLFITVPSENKTETSAPPASNQTSHIRGIRSSSEPRRGNYARSPRAPTTPVKKKPAEKIPLPLPKNVLLISLMEMAQMEAHAKQNPREKKPKKVRSIASSELLQLRTVASNTSESSTEVILSGNLENRYTQKSVSFDEDNFNLSSSDEEDYDEDFDDEEDRVLTAIGFVSSTCGTYAVTDKSGLIVLPRKPEDADSENHNYTSSLRRSYSPSFKPVGPHSSPAPKKKEAHTAPTSPLAGMDDLKMSSPILKKTYAEPPLPYELKYGAKVQIVSINDNWATLARNGGYLYVDSSQLAKVGGPEDKACEIEGMLINLHQTRKEIEQRRETLNNVEENLINKLQKAIEQPFSFYVPPRQYDEDIFKPDEDRKTNNLLDALNLASPKPAYNDNNQAPTTPKRSPIDHNEVESNQLALPNLSPTLAASNSTSPQSPPRIVIPPAARRSPSRQIQQPPYQRRYSLPSPASPTSHIDFRTGLSGHHALSRSSPSSRHPPPHSRPAIRMMGEHRGIGGATNAVGSWRILRRTGSRDSSENRNESGRSNILCMHQDSRTATEEK